METDEDHATMRESSSLVQNLLFTEYTDIFPAWCVGKYGWKTLESRCILIWFFGRNFWCPWHCKRCERTSFGTQYITVLLLNKVSHRPLKKWQGPCNCYSEKLACLNISHLFQSSSWATMAGSQFIYISSPLDFSSMVCLRYPSSSSSDPATSDFSLTTMRCRQLIFQFSSQLIACPRTEENAVLVVS